MGIVADFSGTIATDQAGCSIATMGTKQPSFSYKRSFLHGIPFVTFQCEEADLRKILMRINSLQTFDEKAVQWYSYTLLVPVMSRFVAAFSDQPSEHTKHLWQKTVKGIYWLRRKRWFLAYDFWDGERAEAAFWWLRAIFG